MVAVISWGHSTLWRWLLSSKNSQDSNHFQSQEDHIFDDMLEEEQSKIQRPPPLLTPQKLAPKGWDDDNSFVSFCIMAVGHSTPLPPPLLPTPPHVGAFINEACWAMNAMADREVYPAMLEWVRVERKWCRDMSVSSWSLWSCRMESVQVNFKDWTTAWLIFV